MEEMTFRGADGGPGGGGGDESGREGSEGGARGEILGGGKREDGSRWAETERRKSDVNFKETVDA